MHGSPDRGDHAGPQGRRGGSRGRTCRSRHAAGRPAGGKGRPAAVVRRTACINPAGGQSPRRMRVERQCRPAGASRAGQHGHPVGPFVRQGRAAHTTCHAALGAASAGQALLTAVRRTRHLRRRARESGPGSCSSDARRAGPRVRKALSNAELTTEAPRRGQPRTWRARAPR